MRYRPNRQASAIPFTQPPPLGGWNTRDDISSMPPQDAQYLENWLPDVNSVQMRKGSALSRNLVLSQPITAIFEFRSETIVRSVIATTTTLWVSGPVSGLSYGLRTGLTNGNWSVVNFNNAMALFNGSDAPLSYNGGDQVADMTELAVTGPANVTKLIDAHVHRGRVFYVEDNTCGFWYGAADTLGGALTFFPLSRVARQGGTLLSIKSWTVDGGDGPDDYAVFIMSSGEIIVYQGNDPGRSSAWGLVGRYTIGKPLGRRAIAQMGAQIAVITEQDYVFLPSCFAQPSPPPTKLTGALKEAVASYRSLPGWQLLYHPTGGWLIANIPTGVLSSEQHVMNLRAAGASTKFTGWDTRAFGVVDGVLYYGGHRSSAYGLVFEANVGTVDQLTASTTASITARAWVSPSNLGQEHPKHVVDYQLLMKSEGTITISSGLAYDYSVPDFEQSVALQAGGTPWNTSEWGAAWSEEDFIKAEWIAGAGDGTYVQMRSVVTAPHQNVRWLKTRFRHRITDQLE
jgi:hypothetical protein